MRITPIRFDLLASEDQWGISTGSYGSAWMVNTKRHLFLTLSPPLTLPLPEVTVDFRSNAPAGPSCLYFVATPRMFVNTTTVLSDYGPIRRLIQKCGCRIKQPPNTPDLTTTDQPKYKVLRVVILSAEIHLLTLDMRSDLVCTTIFPKVLLCGNVYLQ